MRRVHPVPHFECVDIANVESLFFESRTHRAYLKIPFSGKRGSETLCIIGQNPSSADEEYADKTIHYLEKLIYQKYVQYRQLIVLNLYSQVDTDKSKLDNALHNDCEIIFEEIINHERSFLIVCGALTNKKPYFFRDRVSQIQSLLQDKRVYKLNLCTKYAPHPGNPRILYKNFNIELSLHLFDDLK